MKKWLKFTIPTILVVTIVMTIVALLPTATINASNDYLSIGITNTRETVATSPYKLLPFNYPQSTTVTFSPTTSTSGWVNPTYAYADGGTYSNIDSGNPSASSTYGGYGLNLVGNVIDYVRVRVDAHNIETTSQTRYPISDYATSTGTWTVYPTSPTTRWDKVDEITSDGDSTYLTHGTTAGYSMFGFSAFTVPPDAVITNLIVYVVARDVTSGTNKVQPCLRIGGTNYLTTSASTEVPTAYGTISYAYAVNPKTASAWTVADINGTGANPLQYFGARSADANPSFRITQVYAVVNYTTAGDDQIRVDVSWDNGNSWSDKHVQALTGVESTYWIDVTADTYWTEVKLTDTNFKVRVDAQTVGNVSNVKLDWLPVEVSYTARPDIIVDATNKYSINSYGETITIGGLEKATTFKPAVIFSRFGGESSVGLTFVPAIGNAFSTSTLNGKAVTASTDVYSIKYEATPTKAGFNELGGLDMTITLLSNPSTNILTFTYDHTLATAYLQPPLTQAEIDEGCVRPDYVVNSIAFYHETKGGTVTQTDADRGLTTGKIGHLYRMRCTDSSTIPKTTWLDWSLSGGNIIGTIDATWLSTATYPVTIAPVGDTFGFGTGGGTEVDIYGDDVYGMVATGASGTGVSISAYLRRYSSNKYMKGVLVKDSDLTIIANGTGSASAAIPAADDWVVSSFAVAPTITAIDYVVGMIVSGDAGYHYDATAGYTRKVDASNSYATPADLGSATSTASRRVSIYCTYTPAASFDITETTTSKAFGFVAASATLYAHDHSPVDPTNVAEGDCTFTLTNNAASICDLDMKMADFTGGVGWNIEETANPSTDEVMITAYYVGQNVVNGLLLKNADQEFYDALAGSAHIHWDFSMLTGTSFTDGVAKSGVLTITAVAED